MSDTKPPITADHLDLLEAEAGAPFDPKLRAFLLNPLGILMEENACLDIDSEVYLFGLLWPPHNFEYGCMLLVVDINGNWIVRLFDNSAQYTIGALVGEHFIGPDLVVCAIDEEEGMRMVEYADIADMTAAATANIPYNAGRRARDDGKDQETNPYLTSTPAFQMWQDAWNTRDEEERPISGSLAY